MRPTKIELTQDPHCCLMTSEGVPYLRMELHDGGGGEFLVMHAAHWAMDTPEEIDILAAELKAMLANSKRKGR